MYHLFQTKNVEILDFPILFSLYLENGKDLAGNRLYFKSDSDEYNMK